MICQQFVKSLNYVPKLLRSETYVWASMLSDLNQAFQTPYLVLYLFTWNLMQPQMVCLQYVETRKCGAIEFLTFAWIVFSLQLSLAILIKKTQLALFYTLSASVWFTQTFDDVSIKRRNDSWFAYSLLWGLLTSIFTTLPTPPKHMRPAYWLNNKKILSFFF